MNGKAGWTSTSSSVMTVCFVCSEVGRGSIPAQSDVKHCSVRRLQYVLFPYFELGKTNHACAKFIQHKTYFSRKRNVLNGTLFGTNIIRQVLIGIVHENSFHICSCSCFVVWSSQWWHWSSARLTRRGSGVWTTRTSRSVTYGVCCIFVSCTATIDQIR